jgi:hypothetical protein
MDYIEKNKILYKHQYGFRKGHSTIHPIIQFLNKIADANNNANPELTMGIFIDLKKAFDTISHDILVNKLKQYGIRGITNTWIQDYLTNRSQFVSFGETTSSTQTITCGIPQGSILGPLLFLLYINDVSNALQITTLSFADDTTLLVTDQNVTYLYKRASTELNLLNDWLGANKLALNTDKTKYMIFCPKHRKYINSNLKLSINNITLSQVGDNKKEKTIKFLGLHIDEHITWKHHISQINTKLSKTLFAINKAKNTLPKTALKALYNALIQPVINYGILAWGSAINNTNNKTLLMQKRAIRTINNMPYNSHTEPLFKKNEILKISEVYKLEIVKFMINYEQNKLPNSFANLFPHNNEIHTARTTRQANHIHVKLTTNQFVSNLPKFKIPLYWNTTVDKIDLTKSKHLLQSTIKHNMLNSYLEIVNCTNTYCRQCYPN